MIDLQDNEEEENVEEDDSAISLVSAAPTTSSVHSQEGVTQSQLIQSLKVDNFHTYMLRWIVKQYVPFTAVEDSDFRAMLMTLN
jgi:hypothetical protein